MLVTVVAIVEFVKFVQWLPALCATETTRMETSRLVNLCAGSFNFKIASLADAVVQLVIMTFAVR